jgi:hypothetical protein
MELQDVINEMQDLGYEVKTRPYELNVVGIRNPNISVPENYEDNIAYFFYDNNGNLQGKVAEGTTTPSVFYLQNPIEGSTGGTAILKQGQYKDAYGIGIHRSKYEALTQQKPVTVIRDSDRNSILNYFGNTTTGMYGINVHRSTPSTASEDKIGQDSAGCQVFRFRGDFDEMMSFARKSRDMYGNKFNYTLIDQREQMQNQRKRVVNYGLVGGILIGLSGYMYVLYKKGIIFKK